MGLVGLVVECHVYNTTVRNKPGCGAAQEVEAEWVVLYHCVTQQVSS